MITFTPTPVFNKNVKRLAKRYPSFIEDLKVFLKDLEKKPEQGTRARVITVNCLVEEKEGEVFLVTIYDKSHTESITKKEMVTAYNSLKK